MNDRAVSVTVNYALALAVTTVLMSGLLLATGDVLDNRREAAIRAELDVVGQRLAAGIMTADRLTQAGGSEVRVSVSMPDRVAGSHYDVEVTASANGAYLLLETRDPITSTNVTFHNRTAVESMTVAGGDVQIVLAPDGDLEVESA